MAIGKVPLSEAMNLPLAFEVTEELLESGRASLEASLREHGWKGPSRPVTASAGSGSDASSAVQSKNKNDEIKEQDAINELIGSGIPGEEAIDG